LEVPNEMQIEPSKRDRKGTGRGRIAAILAGATLVLGGTATAIAAQVPVLERDGQLERSLVTDDARQDYHRLYDEAEKLEVEPKRNVAAGAVRAPELAVEYASLSAEVAKEKVKERVERAERKKEKPKFGTPESVGVSQSTLESIAACESGGDPTIVDASGTYHGKYQFDVQTWASVGGSGLPSAAPEAEQDYRAALLYSQSGSSPWPVCG
jgi:peptidoglycan endopeptidase LytE